MRGKREKGNKMRKKKEKEKEMYYTSHLINESAINSFMSLQKKKSSLKDYKRSARGPTFASYFFASLHFLPFLLGS
jgi:hypothetical protein